MKVAIVTGGTTGIGGATTRLLVAQGYSVLMVALGDPDNLESELKAAGHDAVFLEIDLARSQIAAKSVVNEAIRIWGRIDLVVNGAATVHSQEIEGITDPDWDRIFAINLKAPFFIMQQAIPYLKESKGNIVNISSTNAWYPAKKNQLYDSLKAALNNLTESFSIEMREFGVRVNAVMPGGTRTPLVEEWLKNLLGRDLVEADFDRPSIAEPESIARVIVALASDEMSWVNGVTLPIDGGFRLGK